MATAQATKNTITLKGSTAIVTEFFGYAVNSILYQRGIYPPETFERKQKYGLGMLVTTDDGLKTYLVSVLQQINDWMMTKALQKLVLVVTAVGSKEVLERWVFDVEQEGVETADGKLVDAKDLWGTDAVDTEDTLKERHGKGFRVAAIGQGGENLSLISGIVNNAPVMEIQEVADSSLTCILGRESAYSGKELEFKFLAEQAKLKLRPDGIDDGPKAGDANLPFPGVRRPGKYKIV